MIKSWKAKTFLQKPLFKSKMIVGEDLYALGPHYFLLTAQLWSIWEVSVAPYLPTHFCIKQRE